MAKGHARHRGDNKYQLEVYLGSIVDPVTKKRKKLKEYRTVEAKNQKEADRELAKFMLEVGAEGYKKPEKMSFFDFVQNEWLPKCGVKRLAHTTLATHIEYLELRILPAFQHFQLDQIKPRHVVDFLHNLEEDGMRLDKKKDKEGNLIKKDGKLSSSTIFYHYRILNNVFNFALELKLIKESPLEGVRKPTVEYEEVEPYTLEEAVALYAALEQELLHWQITVKLAITQGMRRSELYGLDLLKHIDLPSRTVKVRQALTYTKIEGYQLHEIKKGSRRAKKRDIALPNDLVEPIERLILQRKKERLAFQKEELWGNGEHFLLLCHEDGTPFNPSSMKNWWKRFLNRHNLRYVNIHGLRHTMVNLLIELDTPLSQISKRAGHSGIGITSDTYGHRIKSVDQLATEKLEQALNKKIH